jgi:hypothetical protein
MNRVGMKYIYIMKNAAKIIFYAVYIKKCKRILVPISDVVWSVYLPNAVYTQDFRK